MCLYVEKKSQICDNRLCLIRLCPAESIKYRSHPIVYKTFYNLQFTIYGFWLTSGYLHA